MNRTARLALAAGATLACAGLGVTAPASAGVAQHCPTTADSTKYEVGAGPTYAAGLPEGTQVCIKAGTQITWATADADGNIANTEIKNKPGNAYLGISYYVVYPCDTEYGAECEPSSGGGS